jgi:hypothetical protein
VAESCPDEQTTCHHLGNGPGPVRDDEVVVLAVFANTNRVNGKLTGDSFRNSQLKRGELSLARRQHTNKQEFIACVLTPGAAREGQSEGGCTANVCDIRQKVLIAPDVAAPELTVRAICVLDMVVPGDHEGHAALKYAELPGQIPERRLGSLRAMIREQLAEQFSDIATCDEIWAVA